MSGLEPSASLEPKTATPRCRVLLAEDDSATRRIVAELLVEDGFEVVEARTGHELFLRLSEVMGAMERDGASYAIVADLKMPGFSGLDVLRSMHDAAWRVPFVVMTAIQDPAVHAEAFRLGARAVLLKPLAYLDLKAAVAAMFAT